MSALVFAFDGPALSKEVVLSEKQIESLSVETRAATSADKEAVAFIPATVTPPIGGRVALTAPYSGTVLTFAVLPGQQIKKGQPVAAIASREFVEVQARAKQSQADLQSAQAVARRLRSLAELRLINSTRADEAEAQVGKIQAVVDETARLLSIGGIQTNPDGSFTIVSSASGRVVETRVTPGDSLENMGTVAVIDTSDELWIKAHIPGLLVDRIKPGDQIHVTNGPAGRVVSVAGSLDPLTRSAQLLARLDTPSGLIAGQLVSISIDKPAASGSLEVPASAVIWSVGRNIVFVRNKTGFKICDVTVRSKTVEAAIVDGDLKPGDLVAISGLAQLEQMMSGE